MTTFVSNAPSKWRFYVYELRDPRCGSTFYVGKGIKQRMFQHVVEARAGKKSAKCERIRQIESAGFSVVETEVARFSNEDAAYEHEAERIVDYGLDSLTNVIPGGTGAYERYARAKKSKPIFDEKTVTSYSNILRRVLVAYHAGIRVKSLGYEWVVPSYEMAMRLRDRVGYSFFDYHVLGVEPCHS